VPAGNGSEWPGQESGPISREFVSKDEDLQRLRTMGAIEERQEREHVALLLDDGQAPVFSSSERGQIERFKLRIGFLQ
jgi:hypothetical protein